MSFFLQSNAFFFIIKIVVKAPLRQIRLTTPHNDPDLQSLTSTARAVAASAIAVASVTPAAYLISSLAYSTETQVRHFITK